MTDTMPVGLHLPSYEADFLDWLRLVLNSTGDGVRAEVETGEDAILVMFPSGGQRTLYVDPRPHGEGVMVQRMRMEELSERAEEAESDKRDAESELGEAQEELRNAQDVIDDARALLESIEWDERAAELPEWLMDTVERAVFKLETPL